MLLSIADYHASRSTKGYPFLIHVEELEPGRCVPIHTQHTTARTDSHAVLLT